MKLSVKKLVLSNFKGQNTSFELSINTVILGANGSGKTTQYDAFLWLLFGKDSQGRKDYNIKPRHLDGTEAQQTDVSVYGEFDINNQTISLKRIFREKWETKKGEETARFTGNESVFEIDSVACNATNFKKQIDAIINEDQFRLITSTSFFNNMKWQDRKTMLLKMAGEPTREEIAGGDPSLTAFLQSAMGKDLEQFRKEVAAKKKPIKEQKDVIPSKIEENKRGIIEKDWISIESNISTRRQEIRDLETQITNEGERLEEANKETLSRSSAIQNDITKLSSQKFTIEQKHKDTFQRDTEAQKNIKNKIAYEINNLQSRQAEIGKSISQKQPLVESKGKEKAILLERYTAIQQGRETDKICPACGQDVPEELFAKKISDLLASVNQIGLSLKTETDNLNKEILQLTNEKAEIPKKIEELQSQLSSLPPIKHYVSTCQEDAEYKSTVKLLEEKKEMLDMLAESFQKPNDLSAVKEKITGLRKEVDDLNQELYQKKTVEDKKQRNQSLEAEYKRLSEEYANLEKLEIASDRFNKNRTTMMEDKINSLFSLVKWMMYKPQINGGEEEFWECSIDGVPYSSLNTAGQINASLDVINTFNRVYNYSAPIFIDGRESVTEIIPVNAQTISLVVSPDHKVLTIKQ